MQKTPLDARHRALGARMIPFAGWDMPVQYSSILEEHRAVRSNAALFDLSHMAELWIRGPQSAAMLDYAVVSAPSRLAVDRAHYSMIADADGGVIDDLIIYRTAEDEFLVVANASNRTAVAAALTARLVGFTATLEDATMRTALIAIQGPRSRELLQPHCNVNLEARKYYSIAAAEVCKRPAWIARTGYTGEDGFEILLDWDDAERVWNHLLAEGKASGLVPAGLGARDTLRLEAGMPLYGQELGPGISPFEAGLGRVVKFDKAGDFVGRAALEAQSQAPGRKLVGLKLTGRGIARTGYPIYLPAAEATVGEVTSGTSSPTLGYSIAMAYLPAGNASEGTTVEVGIRNDRVAAEVIALPFYRRST